MGRHQTEPCPQAPPLPEDIQLHILSLLPSELKAWTARLVNKAARAEFSDFVCLSASGPNLPLEASQKFLAHAANQCEEQQLIAARAACGDLAAVQWLAQHKCAVDSRLCSAAAANGQLAVLQWARMQDPPLPWNSNVCCAAAREGHLAVLEWARGHQCPWNSDVCYYAAKGGHLAVLQWARQQDPPCPWTSSVCWWAAALGHLDILQWARAQDPPCPWDSRVCWWAASEGQLAVLQWLRAQHPPCPWNKAVCKEAAKHFRQQHVADWLEREYEGEYVWH